jgi:hypothetical protein
MRIRLLIFQQVPSVPETPGGATRTFKERIQKLYKKAGFAFTDLNVLEEIYDLRSRLVHGDMASGYRAKANTLIMTIHEVYEVLIKFIFSNDEALKIFSSNKSPEDSLSEIRKYFL